MNAQLETLVELYLTRGGKVFVSPQYDIPYDKEAKDGGTCPDIVALDIAEREIIVVEVSSAADLKPLWQKVSDRRARWFEPIQRRLQADKIVGNDWQIRFIGFVRQALVANSKSQFTHDADVCFFPLEKAAFSFAYWTEREQGLPR